MNGFLAGRARGSVVVKALAAALLGVTLALPFGTPAPILAETGPWSEPVRISEDPSGWFPDVAADDDGRVHVVWQGGASRRSRFDVSSLFYARKADGSWSRPNDIALISPRGHALRSSIATDSDGRVHLVYKGLGELTPGSLGEENIWYRQAEPELAGSSQAWTRSVRLTGEPQGYFSDVAVDSQGTLHVIWTESGGGRWGIYYAASKDGGATWSRRVPLDEYGSVWWYRAHLKTDSRDGLHVVWERLALDGGHGAFVSVEYARSNDGGRTWRRTSIPNDVVLDPSYVVDGPSPQQPSIGIDGQGNVLLVYREPWSNRIRYRVSSGGEPFGAPVDLPGLGPGVPRPYDVYDMATDSAGHVHLVAVTYADSSETMALQHGEWDGKTWLEPRPITTSPPFPEYPRITVAEGNRLHVVWFGGDDPSVDRVPTGIWYSSALSASPATKTLVGAAPFRAPIAPPSDLMEARDVGRLSSANLFPPPRPLPEEQRRSDTGSGILGAPIDPNYPLLVGVAPVIALLLVVATPRLLAALLGAIRQRRRWDVYRAGEHTQL